MAIGCPGSWRRQMPTNVLESGAAMVQGISNQKPESSAMKLCPQCKATPWPFAMVLFISSIVAFLTWLMLGFVGADRISTLIGTVLAFVAVGGTMLHYVLACMKRHCRHGGRPAPHHHHHHGAVS
jgi:hypothetical protein